MKETEHNGIRLLQFGLLQSDALIHFTTTIQGGISQGAYASFNLGNMSDDDALCVIENRRRLAVALNILPHNLYIPHQTHHDKIVAIDTPFLNLPQAEQKEKLEGVDALITNQKEICIGVTTADCVPVLLYDPRKEVFAAVHAGWKGTVDRIAAKTVEVMTSDFACLPQDILVGIGPSISLPHFEVGEEVGDAFATKGFDLSAISQRNKLTGKLHIDLWKANEAQLHEAGILPRHIETSGMCTYTGSDKFFSARRQTIHSGRMLSGGMLISSK